jgi:hypothetical protein
MLLKDWHQMATSSTILLHLERNYLESSRREEEIESTKLKEMLQVLTNKD